MNYFYIENNEQKGPFNLDELKGLSISKKTLIWHEELTDWTEAQYIDDLKVLFAHSQPPRIPIAKKEPPIYTSPHTIEKPRKEQRSNRKLEVTLIVATLIVFLSIGAYYLTKPGSSDKVNGKSQFYNSNNEKSNNNSQYQEKNDYQKQQYQQPKPRQLTEAEIRKNLYNKESSNPAGYLSTDATYRVNLSANTIIEGTIYNNASIAGFKNIKLTAKFYSKTDVLLGSESFLVMDFVAPNGSLAFRNKISGWWSKIDHWTLTINSAESY